MVINMTVCRLYAKQNSPRADVKRGTKKAIAHPYHNADPGAGGFLPSAAGKCAAGMRTGIRKLYR